MRVCELTIVVWLAMCAPATADWQVGVASTRITPTEPMWMSGYASRDHGATGKLTELWAKALVLQDQSGHRGVIVSLDLVGIDRQTSLGIRRRLIENHGLDVADVVLCTSHTHSGPVFGSNLKAMYDLDEAEWAKVTDFTRQVGDDVVRIVDEALGNLQPAELCWGVGRCSFAVNRRENRASDVPMLRETGELKGPVDHEVPVLCATIGGEPIAVLFGYACHATTLSGYEWCGDWPTYAQMAIEEAHPGVTALFFAGCGADQNPLPRRKVELAEQYGEQLAASVDAVLEGEMQPVSPNLQTTYDEIELAFAHVPTAGELEQALQSDNVYEVRRARHHLARHGDAESIPAAYPYPVQSWRLGDVTGVFLGGEVVVDYSRAIKGLDPPAGFVAGYCNDVMAYIPSERVLAEGGYEGATSMVYYGQPSPWKSGLEKKILETVQSQLKSLAP